MHMHGSWSRVFWQAALSLVFILALAVGHAVAFEVSPEITVDAPVYTVPMRGPQEDPAVAFNGSIYLVVWNPSQYPYEALAAARVGQNGVLLDQIPIIILEGQSTESTTVESDGDGFLVVWRESQSYDDGHLFARRVSAAGELLDATSIAVTPNATLVGDPSLAFDGANYMVAYEAQFGGPTGSFDILGVRISPEGEVLDPNGFVISNFDGWQTYPSLAFNGTNYLVAWEDTRYYQTIGEEVYGARVTPDGEVLDTPNILIATGFSDQSIPRVASNGADFMAIWMDHRDGVDYQVYGARVAASGEVLDPQPFAISQEGGIEYLYAITSDGADYLITWDNDPIWRTRIAADGGFLDPEPVIFLDLGDNTYGRQVINNGTAYFAVWSDERLGDADVYGARVSADGVVLDQNGLLYSLQSNAEWNPGAAFDGINYLVVWGDDRNMTDGHDHLINIYGARITPEGTSLDPDGIPIAIGSAYLTSPVAAFNGENYLVTWTTCDKAIYHCDVYGTRVTPAGQVLDPGFITISAGAGCGSAPTVASDGQSFFVAWQDNCLGLDDIFGARIGPDGDLLEPGRFPISTADNYQETPAAAFGGDVYLVVWSDRRHDSGSSWMEIYGARVRPDGTVMDSNGFPIALLNGDRYIWPALAFGDQEFLTAWQAWSAEDILGARVNGTGQVLDADPIAVATSDQQQSLPKVTFDGVHFFVVWEERRDSNSQVYGTRISAGGAVLDPDGLVISATEQEEDFNGIASDGQGQAIVAYSSYIFSWDPPYYPARVRCRLVNTLDDDTVDDDTVDDDTIDDDTIDDDTIDDDTTDDDATDDDVTDDDTANDDATDDDVTDDDIADDDAIDDDAADDDASDDDASRGGSGSHHHNHSDDGQWCG